MKQWIVIVFSKAKVASIRKKAEAQYRIADIFRRRSDEIWILVFSDKKPSIVGVSTRSASLSEVL